MLKNEKIKALWVFAIQTDFIVKSSQRPDIIAIDKQKKECKIIDTFVPEDQNVRSKEIERLTKYMKLRLQL